MAEDDASMGVIQPYLDQIPAYGTGAEVGAVVVATFASLLLLRFIFKPIVRAVVIRTEAQWDQLLLDPLFTRTYLFVIVFGTNLGWIWIDRPSLEPVQNHFLMVFVIIMTSMLTVTIKHLFPRVMARFSSEKGVVIGGSSSCRPSSCGSAFGCLA
jgi:hypothetical protein